MLSCARYGFTVVAPAPMATAMACTSRHSAVRTLRLVKVRSELLTRWVCTAAVARIIGIRALAGPWRSSVRNRWVRPSRTRSSASRRMRPSASRSPFSPPATGKVQSITAALGPRNSSSASCSPVVSTGLSSCSRSHWSAVSSSTLPRLPSRVARLITRVSRKLSIGGLVTWLKAWRK